MTDPEVLPPDPVPNAPTGLAPYRWRPGERKPGQAPPFPKGVSGNPGGLPSTYHEARRIARQAAPEMVERLIQIARGRDERAATVAAQAVLDRAFGKPKEAPPVEEASRPDLSNLSDRDLATLRRLMAKVIAPAKRDEGS